MNRYSSGGLLLALLLLAAAAGGAERDPVTTPGSATAGSAEPAAVPTGMVHIPAGTYRPQYQPLVRDVAGALVPTRRQGVPIPAFFLDALPVTNTQYAAFLSADPLWARSRVLRAFADPAYLSRWAADHEPGLRAPAQAPVVEVSWFAASAYCQWRGVRLPTTAEWEYAARGGEVDADGRQNPAFMQRVLDWYARPVPDVLPPVGSVYRNAWGVYDLHGLVWEWSEDYAFRLDRGESGSAAAKRALFCGAGSVGAFDPGDYAAFMRFAFRSSLRSEYTVSSLGFRCAASVP